MQEQVELAPVHCELREIRSFYQDAKSTDQQKKKKKKKNKFQKLFSFFGNSFPK